jgi:toluene monooxygenase system ferredoxin subunit
VTRTIVCRRQECPRDGLKAFDVGAGRRVLIATSGRQVYAYQASCPHMDVALEEGFYDGAIITCHQHLWQWDVRTGAAMGQAEAPLERYELAEADGVLYLVSPCEAPGDAPARREA